MNNILDNTESIISDIINRLLNCRQMNSLWAIGNVKGELDLLYPNINLTIVNSLTNVSGDVVYIHADANYKIDDDIKWIQDNRTTKDIVIFISQDNEKALEALSNLRIPYFIENKGGLFLLGKTFDARYDVVLPKDFNVLAIVHFFNEADILARTIEYLLSQDVDIYLIDNWSDDGSYEIAYEYQQKHSERIFLERFPEKGKSEFYEWYNQLERTEEISKNLDYNWFIHYDADEIRVAPWKGVTLREAIYWIDMQGYNCVENTVIDFRMTKDKTDNIFMLDTFFDFRHQKKWFDQVKTWKKNVQIDLKSTGGHWAKVPNCKIYPLKILNRHYPLRSIEQAQKKIFKDRIPRFKKEQAERGWHGHYDKFVNEQGVVYKENDMLLWGNETYDKLYIPLFMECGIRWDIQTDAIETSFPEIINKKVVIYGAGIIGKKILQQEINRNTIVGWIDSNYESISMFFCMQAVSVEELKNMEYDYILVAVKNKETQQQIKDALVGMQVEKEKIVMYGG